MVFAHIWNWVSSWNIQIAALDLSIWKKEHFRDIWEVFTNRGDVHEIITFAQARGISMSFSYADLLEVEMLAFYTRHELF